MFNKSKANGSSDVEYRQPLLDAEAQASNRVSDDDIDNEHGALATPMTAGGSKVVKFKEHVQVRVIAPTLRSMNSSRETGQSYISFVLNTTCYLCRI